MIKEFTLGAVQWTVEVSNERLDDLGIMGLCEFSKSLITMHDKIESKELIEQTIYHEVIHAILFTMNRNELSGDEEFVSTFAAFLHQFEKTKK